MGMMASLYEHTRMYNLPYVIRPPYSLARPTVLYSVYVLISQTYDSYEFFVSVIVFFVSTIVNLAVRRLR